jgi:hypothetical protein
VSICLSLTAKHAGRSDLARGGVDPEHRHGPRKKNGPALSRPTPHQGGDRYRETAILGIRRYPQAYGSVNRKLTDGSGDRRLGLALIMPVAARCPPGQRRGELVA